jgi:hypothetical protein
MKWSVKIVGALMLVLMVWTGGLAHASEPANCLPPTAESAAHFEGDGDEGSPEGEQGVAHHHTGCSGHQLAAPFNRADLDRQGGSGGLLVPGRQAGLHSHDPDGQLRPPIA